MTRLRMAHSEKPVHLLCADNQTLVGAALAKVFSTAGYQVARAADGESAWSMIAPNPAQFGVVIADHFMPRLDGLGLVQRLRNARYAGRILVYSEALSADDDLAYRQLGIDALVEKGPDSARILAIMEAFHASGL